MELKETICFQSEFYHDLKLHKEFNRAGIQCNLFYRWLYILMISLFIWFFWQMVIVLGVPVEYAKYLPGVVGIWMLFEIARLICLHGGGIQFKRTLMLHGGNATHDSVFFCDDAIYTLEQETGNKATLKYDTVRIVYESENLYLLGVKYGLYLMVDKRTLTGTKEEFGQFLYEKCPKLRRKKVRSCRTGRIINFIKWAVIILSLLFAFFFHPWLQINKRLQGQIHNGMSLAEISTELETFGLTPLSDAELVSTENGLFYLSDDKLIHLLFCMGEGIRDYDTGNFDPSRTGVFFTYYWAQYPDAMYTDLLRGISAMSRGSLVIDGISEDHTAAHTDSSIMVDFNLNGKPERIEAVYYEDWYDEQILNTLCDMIFDATGKKLYYADFMDTGCFIFLGDDQWASAFAQRTGLEISSDINDIY